jgi:beta-xylosidase
MSNAQICYMTSDSPLGDYKYSGMVFKNPGTFFSGSSGNNHHAIFEFKGEWYITYHAMVLQSSMGISGGYRSSHIDYIPVNTSNGTISQATGTIGGVKQVVYLNPFERTEAETMAWMGGINTKYGGSNMVVNDIQKGDWIGLSGVDFGSGASAFSAKVSSSAAGVAIKICKDKVDGEVIGYLEVPNTGGELKEVSARLDKEISGVHDLFFVFSGSFEFDSWVFKTADVTLEVSETDLEAPAALSLVAKSTETNIAKIDFYQDGVKIASSSQVPYSCEVKDLEAGVYSFYAIMTDNDGKEYKTPAMDVKVRVPQGPYEGVAQTWPGTFEVERYDVGGEGYAYHDDEAENQGEAFRPDEGVDIDVNGDGHVLGWTMAGEWLEYTVDVLNTDQYNFTATVASGLDGSSFRLYCDEKDITGEVVVPNTEDWGIYTTITGTTSTVTAGKHIIKLVVENSYCNIDKIVFSSKTKKVDFEFTSPVASSEVFAGDKFCVSWKSSEEVEGTFNLNWTGSDGETMVLKEGVASSGSYEATIPDYFAGESGYYTLTQISGGLIPSDFDGQAHSVNNPLIWADVPDVSVIRVDDTYYMVSTTMHMAPGVPIMASKDLARWRIINYAYQTLDNGDACSMNGGKNAYGKGSWASSIKYHKGTWYVLTPSYTTGKTHIYKTTDIKSGKWQTATLPFYHDPSLLFDDDDRVYVVYGGGNISIIELSSDAMSVKSGATSRVLLKSPAAIAGSDFYVECEGAQIMKKDGYYYVFLISWPAGKCRSVLCYRSKSLTGTFEGKVVLQDNGVAQGRVFDTPDGDWYGMFFRDNGSVGRIPYLVPVTWSNDWPVLGNNGKVPSSLQLAASQEKGYGIVTSDEFESGKLPLEWQWNHNPVNDYWSFENGALRLTNGRVDADLVSTQNTLTQRSFGPTCLGWTKMSVKGMKDGDYAGLCALQDLYGYVGVKMSNGSKSIVMVNAGKEVESVSLSQDDVWFRIDMNFNNQADKATFYYSLDGITWKAIGNTLSMKYELTHFVGYRYGLFNFGTKSTGGYVDFDFFKIGEDIESPIFLNKTGEETILAESVTITIEQKSATSFTDNSSVNCAVSPNPATEFIKVTGVSNLKKIELLDINGAIVASSTGSDKLDIPNHLSGKYIVRVYDENMNVIVQKIIVK